MVVSFVSVKLDLAILVIEVMFGINRLSSPNGDGLYESFCEETAMVHDVIVLMNVSSIAKEELTMNLRFRFSLVNWDFR